MTKTDRRQEDTMRQAHADARGRQHDQQIVTQQSEMERRRAAQVGPRGGDQSGELDRHQERSRGPSASRSQDTPARRPWWARLFG
jgi:hypothetical protein